MSVIVFLIYFLTANFSTVHQKFLFAANFFTSLKKSSIKKFKSKYLDVNKLKSLTRMKMTSRNVVIRSSDKFNYAL